MKIWLPINVSPTGGASSFATKFKAGMGQHGHEVTLGLTAPAHYDILLVSPRAPLNLVQQARRQNKVIIHRLDGAYYPATPAGWLFPAYNAPLTAIQYMSHYTIYQSEYAQWICRRLVGPRSPQRSTIIYNGVDAKQFAPDGPKAPLKTSSTATMFITVQQFRRADQIDPLIAALKIYQEKYNSNAILAIAGDFVGPAEKLVLLLEKNSALRLLGPINNDQLPPYLRAADAFLYCHPNPACPNNVLEAMACGLPIVGVADGAMPELVRDGKDGYLVTPPHRWTTTLDEGHIWPRHFPAPTFANAMHEAVLNKEALSTNAHARIVSSFTWERMIDNYTAALQAVEK